jgi:hypothetical protein
MDDNKFYLFYEGFVIFMSLEIAYPKNNDNFISNLDK